MRSTQGSQAAHDTVFSRYPLFLLLIVTALFAFSLLPRLPYLGAVGVPVSGESINPEINTLISARSVNEWFEERPPLHHLVIMCFPETLERPTPGLRVREIAYFPITWLPLYAYALATNDPIQLHEVQALTLLCQFLVALPLALLVHLLLCRHFAPLTSLAYATITALLVLYLPGARYLFLYCYFPDVAVLPFVAWTLYLEALRDDARHTGNAKRASRLGIAVSLFIFTGALTEWLGYLIGGALALKRILLDGTPFTLRGAVNTTFRTLLPVAAAALLFATWVTINTGWMEVLFKFLVHAGISEGNVDESQLWTIYFDRYANWVLGHLGNMLFWLFGIFTMLAAAQWLRPQYARRFPRTLTQALVPPLFTLYVGIFADILLLPDHHVENPHTALKLVLPMSIALPLSVALLSRVLTSPGAAWAHRSHLRHAALTAALALLLLALDPSIYRDQIHTGTRRFEENAAKMDAPLMQPDILFATFAHGGEDIYAAPLFYGRQVQTLTTLQDTLPYLTRELQPLDESPEIKRIFEIGRILGLNPPFLFRMPQAFTIGFAHWKEETPPPIFNTLAPIANQRFETQHAILYLLDQDSILTLAELLRAQPTS